MPHSVRGCFNLSTKIIIIMLHHHRKVWVTIVLVLHPYTSRLVIVRNRDFSGSFFTIFEPMVFHIPVFETFWIHKRGRFQACFSVRLKGVSFFWLRVVHEEEGVSDSDHCLSVEEYPSCFHLFLQSHYIFIVWQTVRIGPFSLGFGVLVGGGW